MDKRRNGQSTDTDWDKAQEQNLERSTDVVSEQSGAVNPTFLLDLDGFEGPLDLLLLLARDQKS